MARYASIRIAPPPGRCQRLRRGAVGAKRIVLLVAAAAVALFLVSGSGAVTPAQEEIDLAASIQRLATVTHHLGSAGPIGAPLALTTVSAGGPSGLGLDDVFAQALSDRLPASDGDLAALAANLSTPAG